SGMRTCSGTRNEKMVGINRMTVSKKDLERIKKGNKPWVAFMDEFFRVRENNPQKTYKVYEKHAKKLGLDLSNQKDVMYWKKDGESITTYGLARFYETKETLKKPLKRNRPDWVENALRDYCRKEVLKNFPKRCTKCGFHRFMCIEVEDTSVEQVVGIRCPNCDKLLWQMKGELDGMI
ncbi:MAG: hypothetical protein ACP5NX_02355, partial [Candidatus Bilamarchaeaceae archaeon]